MVLGLVVAMAALALPLAHEAAQRRRFEGSLDEVVGTLRLARAHARLESKTVEVVLLDAGRGRRRLVAREMDLADLSSEDVGTDAPPIAASWADRLLDLELEASSGRSDQDDPDATRLDAIPVDAVRPEHRRLILFAVDGSAPIAQRLTLRSDDGREARIRVIGWTGQVTVERLDRVGERGRPATANEDADEEEPDG